MKNEKQQQAYNLYFKSNLSQAEIAKLLDVDRKTIHNWMTDGNWRQLKKSAAHIPSKLVEQMYYMVANLNHEILSRGHQPYPLTNELEALRKLTICIRHLKNRQTVNESMEAFTHLADILSRKDPALADQLRPHIQDYIKDRADFKFVENMMEGYECNPRLGELFDYEIRPFDDDETGGLATPAEPTPAPAPTPTPVTAEAPVTPEVPISIAA